MISEKDDGRTGLTDRVVTKDGRIEMGIYPVMFGFRLRAGYVGDGYVHIDWCFGPNLPLLSAFYKSLEKHIDNNLDNPFKDLPGHSKIKPCFNDAEFIETVTNILTHEKV